MNLFTAGIAMTEQHRINTQRMIDHYEEKVPMDRFVFTELGRIRQQEILDWAEKSHDYELTWIWQGALPLNRWRRALGRGMMRHHNGE